MPTGRMVTPPTLSTATPTERTATTRTATTRTATQTAPTPNTPKKEGSARPAHFQSLERCVGDIETFFDKHWNDSPLLRPPLDDGSFDDLASLDDLDHMIASTGVHASNLRMVKSGQALPVTSYTASPGKKSRSNERQVSGSLVYDRFDEGATIVLESLHRYWLPLTDFCRDLELSLGHRLQVNAYITPPGSQGFDVHQDTHDVFVLQVSGSKHWIVYDRDDPELLLIDEEIERGSALYVPKGFPHAASAGRRASAHLTVGILTHDSIDIVREIATLAERESVFSERLPRDVTSDPDALRASVLGHVEDLRAWLDTIDVDRLTQRVARRMMSTSQPIVRGQLSQLVRLDDLNEQTVVVRRRGATCALFPDADSVRVLLSDRELEMPLATRPAIEEIASRERLRVRDLHQHLTPESALVLVRRLIREGLLRVDADD
jgi:bifunctional lysine-specific demethylase and histidyl-hydroxylase NO66